MTPTLSDAERHAAAAAVIAYAATSDASAEREIICRRR